MTLSCTSSTAPARPSPSPLATAPAASASAVGEQSQAPGAPLIAGTSLKAAGVPLSIKRVSTTLEAPAPEGAQALGNPQTLVLSGGARLTGTAQLTLPYDPTQVKPNELVTAAYWDPSTQHWIGVGGTPNPRKHVITVTTSHLSTWTVLGWSAEVVKQIVLGTWHDLVNLTVRADPPTCAGQGGLDLELQHATTDPAALVCGGKDSQGRPVGIVVANRPVGLDVLLPVGSKILHRDLGDVGDLFANVALRANDSKLGFDLPNEYYVPAGRSLTFAITNTVQLPQAFTWHDDNSSIIFDLMLAAVSKVYEAVYGVAVDTANAVTCITNLYTAAKDDGYSKTLILPILGCLAGRHGLAVVLDALLTLVLTPLIAGVAEVDIAKDLYNSSQADVVVWNDNPGYLPPSQRADEAVQQVYDAAKAHNATRLAALCDGPQDSEGRQILLDRFATPGFYDRLVDILRTHPAYTDGDTYPGFTLDDPTYASSDAAALGEAASQTAPKSLFGNGGEGGPVSWDCGDQVMTLDETPSAQIITPNRVGWLPLGVTQSDAEAAGLYSQGNPYLVDGNGITEGLAGCVLGPNQPIYFWQISSPIFHTTQHVGVGSTPAELRRAYGRDLNVLQGPITGSQIYFVQSGANQIAFFVVNGATTVVGVGIDAANRYFASGVGSVCGGGD